MSTQQAQTFPCQQCGAALQWDATKQAMTCPYCHFQQAMPTQAGAGAIREIPIEEGYRTAARGLGAQVQTINCQECGATVNVGQGERTAKCAFCGSAKVLAVETDANAIRPESLVAFQVDKGAANQKFGAWLSGLWFRPNDLKQLAKVQEMGGVYVPFWTFDAQVRSSWNAEAGYYYYETEYYETVENGETVTRERQVQRVRWEPAWGQRQDFYDDVLVCASKGLPSDLVEKFSTFDTTHGLVPYAPGYLAGWRAEAYAIDLPAAHAQGREKIEAAQYARCDGDVPGDTHRGLSVTNEFGNETFKHVLLPIWIAAYRYNDKVYRFLVNGQSGEVVGKAPWSFWKIFLFTLLCLALVGVIGYFISQSQSGSTKPKRSRSETQDDPGQQVQPKKSKREAPTDDDGALPPGWLRGRDGRLASVPV